MKIAFIGYGSMAQALARRWVPLHEVVFAGRNPDKARAVAEALGPKAAVAGSERAAVEGADVVVFATRAEGTFDAIAAAGGPETLAEKIIIDINNPVLGVQEQDFEVKRFDGGSLAEAVAKATGSDKVVKAFNMAQAEVWSLERPAAGQQPFTTFFAGDDAEAKTVVKGLIEATGSLPYDIGALKYAAHLESAAGLVIKLLFSGHPSRTVLNLNLLD